MIAKRRTRIASRAISDRTRRLYRLVKEHLGASASTIIETGCHEMMMCDKKTRIKRIREAIKHADFLAPDRAEIDVYTVSDSAYKVWSRVDESLDDVVAAGCAALWAMHEEVTRYSRKKGWSHV